MKLTYRGIAYEQNQVGLEMTEGDIIGKYRGQTVHNHLLTQELKRPDVESVLLHYRGAEYAVNHAMIPSAAKKQSIAQAPAASCPIKLPQLSKLMSQDVRQVHIENMRQSLERRIQSAQARGDERLVRLLKQAAYAEPVPAPLPVPVYWFIPCNSRIFLLRIQMWEV